MNPVHPQPSTIHSQDLQQPMSEVFGYRSFRQHQEGIVRAILGGQDAFAVMPTGGGKSLCYQLPAHLMNGVCIVVSPLISLMKDHVDSVNSIVIGGRSLFKKTTEQPPSEFISAN